MEENNYVSLKEHFREILAEKDKAIQVAMAAAKEAVSVAERNAEKWRDNANEWRGQSKDREDRFALKTDVSALKEIVENNKIDVDKKIDEISRQLSSLIGNKEGMKDKWGYLVAAFMLVFAIWSWLSNFSR